MDEVERLQARVDALEAELRRERAMFAGGPVVVFRWVAVEGWPVEYVSGNVHELFGWSAADFQSGRVRYADVVHPEDLDRIGGEVAAHSEAGMPSFEQDYRIVRADGAVRWLYDFTAIVRDDQAQVTHYDGYVIDVSARREAELAVRAKDEELRRGQKMEALGRLAGGIAHDFNNLLTAVLGHAELAAVHLPPESKARGPLERIVASVDRASALTRKLLAFSRHQLLEARICDLSRIVADARTLLDPVLGDQVVTVVDIPPAPVLVRVDPSQIEQVVVNLMLNARDAMPRGGRLQVASRSVETRGTALGALGDRIPPGSYGVITVRDEGVGIDPVTLPRVFEPFYSTKGTDGTGLGLATVYGIVRQSNGYLVASSELGRGSSFEVWLPAATGHPGVARELPPLAQPTPLGGTERVLLVEDNAEIREVTRAALERHGYRVAVAADGEQALTAALAEVPDVVITDVMMPRVGGIELVDRLDAAGIHAPVLLVSGYTDRPAPISSTRQAFLQKPFVTERLLRALRALLDA